MIFCRAILHNAGLGNRLFPWARCRVFSHVHHVPMLRPTWAQLKIGPFLRGESDLRLYLHWTKTVPTEIGGIRKIWVRLIAQELPEPHGNRDKNLSVNHGYEVVTFRGERDHFADLKGWSEFLMRSLREVVTDRYLQRSDALKYIPIGMHIRRGDFREAESDGEFQTTGGLRTPLTWFVQALRSVRRAVGCVIPAYVFSDGTPRELEGIVSEPEVKFASTGNAAADLLALSRSRVLIGSGGSSFTAWSAYFGGMPVITRPGQSLCWFKLDANARHGAYVGEFDPSSPSEVFLEQAVHAIRSA